MIISVAEIDADSKSGHIPLGHEYGDSGGPRAGEACSHDDNLSRFAYYCMIIRLSNINGI